MATITRVVATEADLWAAPDDGLRRELVDGEIRCMSPAGGRHGRVAILLASRLHAFVESRGLGFVFDSSTGFRLPSGNVRAPDVAFLAEGQADPLDPGFVPVRPDLAVEILSPGDTRRDVLDKVGEYLDAGTRIVWVVDPARRTATVFRSATDVTAVSDAGTLDGEDLLPGFRCALADVLG